MPKYQVSKKEALEPVLTKEETIQAIYTMLGKTMGIDAIGRCLAHAPYRIFPGGKRKHYRLSEVRVLFEHLLAPVQDEVQDQGRDESLHRRRPRLPKAS